MLHAVQCVVTRHLLYGAHLKAIMLAMAPRAMPALAATRGRGLKRTEAPQFGFNSSMRSRIASARQASSRAQASRRFSQSACLARSAAASVVPSLRL